MRKFFEGAAAGRDALVNPLLGLGSQTHVLPQTNKKPFDRMRCVLHPTSALEKDGPFGKLWLTIDQAAGLLSGDANGLSDPYAMVLLDGEKWFTTKVIQRTLAPRWERTIEIDVHQPFSVLTVMVLDHDFAMASHVLGFVDLRLQHLPINQKAEGWFELCHPVDYRDTILGRVTNKTPSDMSAGRIRLEFELKVAAPMDELFAVCLPEPSLGHGYPNMDLHELVVTASVLSQTANQLKRPVELLVAVLRRRITLVWLAMVFVVWEPVLMLPALVLSLGAMAAFIGRRLKEACEGNGLSAWDSESDKEEAQDAPSAAPSSTSLTTSEAGRRRHHLRNIPHHVKSHMGCMAAPRGVSDPEPAQHSHHSHGELHHRGPHKAQSSHGSAVATTGSAAKEVKTDFRTALRLAQSALPSAQQLSVRMAQGQVGAIHDGLTKVSELLMAHGDKIFAASAGVALLLLLLAGWQGLLMKVVLTLVISIPLCHQSAPGKLALAAIYFYGRRERFEPEELPPTKSGDPFAQKCPALSDADCRKMVLCGPGAQEQDNPHDLKPAKLFRVMRCRQCGKIVATGVSKAPPLRCAVCMQVFCRHCQPFVAKNCRGSQQKGKAGGIKTAR
mmetsp:Transcript_30473/g.86959  ORF Transcript_30473/g.86959 Transcript_30473/m.86959 type:complete len:614 (-) Transcript_30473:99-1940(-)